MYKIRLRDELAEQDEKGIGYQYEVWESEKNPKKVVVRFRNNAGIPKQVTYSKRKVESFIQAGDWILVSPKPSASEWFDKPMALNP